MRWILTLATAFVLAPAAPGTAAADDVDVEVHFLVETMRTGNADARWQAARLLGTLGPQARPAAVYLTIALRDENHTVRYYAARSLAALGPAVGDIAGANLLHVAEHDPDLIVREQAAMALRKVQPTPAFFQVPWLYAKLGLPLNEVLGEFATFRYKTIVELVRELRYGEPAERRQGARLLGRMGWRAAPAAEHLAIALRDEDELVRFYAGQALGYLGPEVYRLAEVALRHAVENDPSQKVRDQAELTLRLVTPRPDPLPGSYAALQQSEIERMMVAASRRFALPPPHDELTVDLWSANPENRRAAAWELAKLRRTDELAVHYLVQALRDADEVVRYNAATALGRLGTAAGEPAVAGLGRMRRRETSQKVLRRAILAMSLVATPAAAETKTPAPDPDNPQPELHFADIDFWIRGLKGPDVQQQIKAIRQVGKLGADGREALPKLVPLLAHDNRFVRTFAAESIGMIGFKDHTSAAQGLAQLANDDSDTMVRSAAKEALLLNFTEELVARLAEPPPPEMPTPQTKVVQQSPLSDEVIHSLMERVREEPQHRDDALKVLAARMEPARYAGFVVPLAMEPEGELRKVGMSWLGNGSPGNDFAAPLAEELHRGLEAGYTAELVDLIEAEQVFAPYLIPYVARSHHAGVREAGARALLRVGSESDWRKLFASRWAGRDGDKQIPARTALETLRPDDRIVLSFIAAMLPQRDDEGMAAGMIAIAAATKVNEGRVSRLHELYRAEQSAQVRHRLVTGLRETQPDDAEATMQLLALMLGDESERGHRELIVGVLQRYGTEAAGALPTLLEQLDRETSLETRMKICEAIKAMGAGNEKLQAIIVPLEASLRIQHAQQVLQEVIAEQNGLEEETRRKQKRSLLRLLGN